MEKEEEGKDGGKDEHEAELDEDNLPLTRLIKP